jgi:hypothetical protein
MVRGHLVLVVLEEDTGHLFVQVCCLLDDVFVTALKVIDIVLIAEYLPIERALRIIWDLYFR